MTDKQIIMKGLEKIENYLARTESSLDIARDYMQEVLDDLKINERRYKRYWKYSKNWWLWKTNGLG